MRSYPPLSTSTPTRIYTITRRDEVVIRITAWTQPIIISGDEWTPMPSLKALPISERNDGTAASTELEISAVAGGLVTSEDILNGIYDGAELLIEIVEADSPATKYFDFYGRIGRVDKPIHGVAKLEARNPHALPRFDLVPSFQVMCRFPFGGVFCAIPIMRPDIVRSTSYAVGNTARYNNGTSPAGYGNTYFEATAITTGVTASSAPSFDYTAGNATTDGGVTWTARNAWERACTIDTVVDRHNFTLTGSPDVRAIDNWYVPGKFMFVTGIQKGRIFKVGGWRVSDFNVTTFLPGGLLAEAGDTGFIWPDCSKTVSMCVNKYANGRRYGGFPYFQGAKAVNLDQ